jgi:hypothetical protein
VAADVDGTEHGDEERHRQKRLNSRNQALATMRLLQ